MLGSFAYTNLLRLGLPFFVLRLAVKGLKEPAYRQRWQERLGWTGYPALPHNNIIWIHAVSVGEVQAAMPLIQGILTGFSGTDIVLTTTTPTGSEYAKKLFPNSIYHTYLPFDIPGLVNRFLGRTHPSLAIFMETEIWPNIFQICARHEIQIIMANARLSPSSFKGYIKVKRFMAQTLDKCQVLAQTVSDRERFLKLGVKPDNIYVMGNLKFDSRLPVQQIQKGKELRKRIAPNRPVWIAASTHAGEEESVLTAHARLRKHVPDCLLILVPRHPERFQAASDLSARMGFSVHAHSQDDLLGSETAVYIGDCMGQMFTFYAASDIAFVGGSLVPTGGHNLLEPASLGLPVIAGPHLFNFQEISSLLSQENGLVIIQDPEALAQTLYTLFQDPKHSRVMGNKAQNVVIQNKGAVNKVLQAIKPYVDGR
ncbi:MAG: lipid IV(A) 3-deoxy-D-manno-octulosonic acid transferase [Desulfohalobiaceae bacterium]|nr:lipid IV(A) 3-deoxy-D-manno-octulosonic acid transferase [Desulfohalobiaceae bacterium]